MPPPDSKGVGDRSAFRAPGPRVDRSVVPPHGPPAPSAVRPPNDSTSAPLPPRQPARHLRHRAGFAPAAAIPTTSTHVRTGTRLGANTGGRLPVRPDKVDERTGQVLDRWSPQTSGARNRRADAMWIQLREVGDEGSDGLEALQHILRIGLQFTVPADLHDVFSHHEKAAQEAYIVESYPGGIGVVKSAYEHWQTVVETGKKIAVECSCSSGCPHCILPTRTPDGFDKREGIRLAQEMLEQGRQPAGSMYHEGMWKPL